MLPKNGSMRNNNGGSNNGNSNNEDGDNQLIAVAVDSDKNSQHALKWAADHILSRGLIFVLLHIRKKIPDDHTQAGQLMPLSEAKEDVSEHIDIQTQELLTPFQCFCSRRGLNCKEVILDDLNVSKAIIDFVLQHGVDKLVLGSSSRNAFSRTFKQADVPYTVSKFAPEFCSIYVISKGKIYSSRSATRPNTRHFNGLLDNIDTAGNQFQSTKSETIARNHTETPRRIALTNTARSEYGSKNGTARGYNNQRYREKGGIHSEVYYYSSASCPSPSRPSIDKQNSYFPREYLDGGRQQPYMSDSKSNEYSYPDELRESYDIYRTCSRSNSYEQSSSLDETDAEMRRLKLELKMAVGKYEDASKKAYNWNADETQRLSVQATGRKVELDSGNAIERGNVLFQEMGNRYSSDLQYTKYSIELLKEVTNNFSESLKIGEGGYGPVFRSTIGCTHVAIKIPRPDVAKGVEQFQKEVEVLSCIRHPNLVLLVGACPEFGCLVYEYMANGNLEDRLFCQSSTTPLPWQLRFKIAAEIASALLFLHQTKPEPLIHRDLKPANILLDDNFVSKITDVGLARLLPTATSTCSSQYLATVAAGTFCYIDPEYQKTGTVGVKSDIYALGIILLQLITARQPMGLSHAAEIAMEKGSFEEMLDPKIKDWPIEETLRIAKLALSCAEIRRRDRPDLGSVVVPVLNRLCEFADVALQITRWE